MLLANIVYFKKHFRVAFVRTPVCVIPQNRINSARHRQTPHFKLHFYVSLDDFRISDDPLINFILIILWQTVGIVCNVVLIVAHEFSHRFPAEMLN
jgi:hypothetical protein